MEVLKLKKNNLVISVDGGAATGTSTAGRLISKKFGLKFLSSGLLYRYASYLLLKYHPKNKMIFLKKHFKNLKLIKLNNLNLHSPKISENTSIIAKERKIREILKQFQRKFSKKYKKVCIEGRDIGTVILPKADIKFFFVCDLKTAAKRRFRELKKTNSNIKLKDVKKSIKMRDYRDKSRKNSPLLKSHDAIIVDTGKLKKIPDMINKMSDIIKKKYGY
ncbi:MAG: (d)CMP kinase [Candidatus Marinimicrobia bacterium]|nr:(d)CMP kinase [Candidatus Neomarinimicrobiota bacterium]